MESLQIDKWKTRYQPNLEKEKKITKPLNKGNPQLPLQI